MHQIQGRQTPVRPRHAQMFRQVVLQSGLVLGGKKGIHGDGTGTTLTAKDFFTFHVGTTQCGDMDMCVC